jgi:hypothetical protein
MLPTSLECFLLVLMLPTSLDSKTYSVFESSFNKIPESFEPMNI